MKVPSSTLPDCTALNNAAVGDLEVDRREPARDAGEEAREAERDEAHHLRIVADELRALGLSRTALHIRPNGVRVIAYIRAMQKRHQTAIR